MRLLAFALDEVSGVIKDALRMNAISFDAVCQGTNSGAEVWPAVMTGMPGEFSDDRCNIPVTCVDVEFSVRRFRLV